MKFDVFNNAPYTKRKFLSNINLLKFWLKWLGFQVSTYLTRILVISTRIFLSRSVYIKLSFLMFCLEVFLELLGVLYTAQQSLHENGRCIVSVVIFHVKFKRGLHFLPIRQDFEVSLVHIFLNYKSCKFDKFLNVKSNDNLIFLVSWTVFNKISKNYENE